MRQHKTQIRLFGGLGALLALTVLVGAAVVASGCQKDRGSAEAAAGTAGPGPEADAALESAAELTERERALAEREAELAAREEQLALQEQAAAAAKSPAPQAGPTAKPAARPSARPAAPAPTPAPAPAPEPEPAPAIAVAEPEPEPDPELAPEPAPTPVPQVPAEPRTVLVTVPAETELEVEFLDSLSSEGSRAGDEFRARVTRQVMADGRVAIPVGSIVRGTVLEAVSLKKIGGRARLALEFDRLEIPSGDRAQIKVSFAEEGKSETKKDAATIGGAAAGGAILGRVLNRSNKTKGGTIGAIVGAAVGTAVAARTEGEELRIERGTVVGLRFDAPVRLEVPRR